MIATTRPEISVSEPTLYVAFELGKKDWKLAMTSGLGVDPWVRTVPSGDLRAVERVLREGRRRLGVPASAPVMSCYEAGRDGFWIHRALTELGLRNRVVDSASIEVNRRARRAKTDRLDALKLVRMLVRVCCRRTARVERSACAERGRRSRAPGQPRADGLDAGADATGQSAARLAGHVGVPPAGATARRVVDDGARLGGRAAAGPVQARLARAETRLAGLEAQIAEIETAQQLAMTAAAPASAVRQLVQLKGVATTSASVLLDEGLVWRRFRNRRQIGGILGFAPTPYDSGETEREQGISRAGNARLQAISIQLAWNWVRWQPQSALTQWYRAHFGTGKRARRIGIVAVARKLVIALWRYVTTGRVPEGAILKVA